MFDNPKINKAMVFGLGKMLLQVTVTYAITTLVMTWLGFPFVLGTTLWVLPITLVLISLAYMVGWWLGNKIIT